MVNNTVIIGTPKSHKSRSVPLPPFLVEDLASASKSADETPTSSATAMNLCDCRTRRTDGSRAPSRGLSRMIRSFPESRRTTSATPRPHSP